MFIRDDATVWDTRTGQRLATVFEARARALALDMTADGQWVLWHTAGGGVDVFAVRAEGLPPVPTPAPNALDANALRALQPSHHLGRGRALNLVWSPDGRWLALNTTETALVFEAETLTLARGFLGDTVLTFDPQGNALLARPQTNLRLVAVTTGDTLRTWAYSGARIARFSGDGRWLALEGALTSPQPDGLLVLDVNKDDQVIINQPGTGRYKEPANLAFTPNGTRLVVSYPGVINLWNTSAGTRLRNPTTGNLGPAHLSPDGLDVAYRTNSGFTIELLETGGRTERRFSAAGTEFFPGGIDNPNYVPFDYAYTPNNRLAVIYNQINQRSRQVAASITEWDPNNLLGSGRARVTVFQLFRYASYTSLYSADYDRANPPRTPAFAFSPDGTRLASLTHDGMVRVWAYPNGALLATSLTDYQPVYAFGPGTRQLALVNALNEVELRDWRTGDLQRTLRLTGSPPNALAYNTTTSLWVFNTASDAEQTPQVTVFDTQTGGVLTTWRGTRFGAWGGFTPDGRTALTWRKVAGGWELLAGPLSGAEAWLNLGRFPTPGALAFSPDSRLVAVVKVRDIEVWDMPTQTLRWRLRATTRKPFGNLLITLDGERLMAASGELWSLTTGDLVRTFDTTSTTLVLSPAGDVALEPNGIMWDTRTGLPVDQAAIPPGVARSMVFAPTGEAVLWQAPEGVWQVWAGPGFP